MKCSSCKKPERKNSNCKKKFTKESETNDRKYSTSVDDSYWSIPTNSIETYSLLDLGDPTKVPLTWKSETGNLYATVV